MDQAIVCAVLTATLAAAVAAAYDRRSGRAPPTAVFTAPVSPCDLVHDDPLYSGWPEQYLRCKYETFEELYKRIKARWCELHIPPGPSSVHDIKTRVTVSLCYLAHEGSYSMAGSLLGVSKSRYIVYVDEITSILSTYLTQDVRLPASHEEWREVEAGFKRVCGAPNAVGAIGGSLFPVHRFADFEGWYCRKRFTAFNMQVSWTVESVSCHSPCPAGPRTTRQSSTTLVLRKPFGDLIPPGTSFLADAGYKLMPHILTPFKFYYGMPRDEARFNYLHSKMRIVVEGALGLFKGRFRLFKNPLRHHSAAKMAQLISATIILHNWRIDVGDIDYPSKPDRGCTLAATPRSQKATL